MALRKDEAERGSAAPAPRRGLPSTPKSTPPSQTSWIGLSALRDAAQPLGPPVPQQQKQQYPLVAPARANVIDITSQQKPLSVQVAPQKQPAIQAPLVADGGYMDGTFPVSPWVVSEDLAAQKAEQVNLAERGRKRGEYEAADRTETAKELTPEKWASLNPLQQASAQANYDLALAVKRDFDTSGKREATDAQRKSYDDRVKALFGEEPSLGYKGVDYAPNTIAFLDARGIEAANLAGRTLDDFVSGASLVTDDIFSALGEQVKSPDIFHTGPSDPRGRNIKFAQDLAKGQLAYQEKLAVQLKKGEQLLTDITSASTNATANTTYGADVAAQTRTKLTAVRPETAAQFDKYMEALARTDLPTDEALKIIGLDLKELGAGTDETAQVWEGLIERSRLGAADKSRWFANIDFPMRSPMEVAQVLGAPTLKRQSTTGAK